MTSQHIKIIAALLVFFAVLLGAGAWYAARTPKPVANPAQSTTSARHVVVVTTQAVTAGVPIPAASVKLMELPVRPDGAYSKVEEVIGQTPVMSLGAGVPLMSSQLASGLATQIEAGQRAVAVNVDEVIGVGNRVVPGDFVDVFFVLKRDGMEVTGTQARLLLPRLRVLAFGSKSVSEPAPKPEESVAGRRTEPIRTAVLAVPVDDVNALVVAQQSGHLLLALRNPSDSEMPTEERFAPVPPVLTPVAGKQAPGTPLDSAAAGLALTGLASPTAPRPVAQPAAARTVSMPVESGVEVIRAGKRTVE
jgi:pilus assembly protein CpaB